MVDLCLIPGILVVMAILTIKGISEELKKQFKLICIADDTTMSAVLLRYIKATIAKKK